MIIATLSTCGGPVTWAQPSGRETESASRVVHLFDFDERKDGNLEDVPMFWSPVRTAGFPRFATGTFDYSVGAKAPPSLYLHSNGRNVAFQYTGPHTRARANSAYQIEFSFKPRVLYGARACVSAQFLDQYGEPLLDTLVRSPFLGGDRKTNWRRTVLSLPAAPSNAATIGLAVWVMQESEWRDGVRPHRHIPRVDVSAGVWIDDIVVRSVPHVELVTTAPGNVFTAQDSNQIRVVLADTEPGGLRGTVSIYAADGGFVRSMQVPISYEGAIEPSLVDVGLLSPGYYRAELQIFVGTKEFLSRHLSFAKLADFGEESPINASPFGVALQPDWRMDPESCVVLLQRQLARSVKLPIWGGLRDRGQSNRDRRRADQLYTQLITDGFFVTGVLFESPTGDASADWSIRSPLLELLADRKGVWEERFSAAVAPYANTIEWWQIGSDNGPPATNADQLISATTNLRKVVKRFVSSPRLVVPEQVMTPHGQENIPVEQVSVSLSQGMSAVDVGSLIEERRKQGIGRISVYIEPLPKTRYARLPRLADWAQRVLTARFEGADTVFTTQTWHKRENQGGHAIEPDEEFVMFRTMAALINDGSPGRRFSIGDQVTCLSFDHGLESTLAMWDPHAPPEGRDYVIQLGRVENAVDLWGRSTSLTRDHHGRHIVRLSPMPVLIPRAETWLIDFRTSMAIEPRHIEAGSEVSGHYLTMTHSGARTISGELELDPPDGWAGSPRHVSFSVMPQRTEKLAVRLIYPHSEVAGEKHVTARIRFIDMPYYMEVPLPLELSLTDVEVSGMAVATGKALVLRHSVTNHTEEVLHFRSAAQVPGRQRQYRPIANLEPGDSQTVEYRFSNVSGLVGAKVRLSLREMNDGPRTHALELTVQ